MLALQQSSTDRALSLAQGYYWAKLPLPSSGAQAYQVERMEVELRPSRSQKHIDLHLR